MAQEDVAHDEMNRIIGHVNYRINRRLRIDANTPSFCGKTKVYYGEQGLMICYYQILPINLFKYAATT